ncbi:MAG: hypothetical protein ACJ8EY_04480 [Sphingomicrobium sp.]
MTVTRSEQVFVLEISCSGARIEGVSLPKVDEEFVLVLGPLRAFALVKWVEGGVCGVQFDVPLAESDIQQLQRAGPAGTVTRKAIEQKQAYEDWTSGVAR